MGERTTTTERGGDDDPDAPWRPGYEGWHPPDDERSGPSLIDRVVPAVDGPEPWSREHDERPREPWQPEPRAPRPRPSPPEPESRAVASVVGQPNSTTSGDVWLAGMAVAALCVVAMVSVVALRPRSNTSVGRTLPLLPEGAATAWEHAVAGVIDDVGVGPELVVLASDGSLEALASSTGEIRWTAQVAGDVDRVTVVEAQVVVELRAAGGRAEVLALDAETGAEVWRSDRADGVISVSGADDGAMLLRRAQVGGAAVIDVIEPLTGEPAGEAFTLSGVTASGVDLAAAPTDRTVAVWSRHERAVVTEPVGSFNLRMVAPHDGAAVALDREGRVILFDADGRRVDEVPFRSDAFGEFANRPRLAGVVDAAPVAIVSSGSSIGYSIDDESIVALWERAGRAEPPVATASGPVALLVGPDASGQIRATIIDPVDGETIAVTDAAGNRERAPLLGHNGYVLAPTIGAATRELTANRYDGSTMWAVDLAPGATYDVAHGVLVVVDSDPAGSRVSLTR